MCSSMQDTSVKHIWRNPSAFLLKLPAELFHTGNCLQLIGALLQKAPEVFSGICLCAVLRSDISHPEKRLLQHPFLCLFGHVQGISIRHENGFAGIWHDSAHGYAMSRSQSRQSSVVSMALASTSFYAWVEVEDEPLAGWLITEWRYRTIDVHIISFHPVCVIGKLINI